MDKIDKQVLTVITIAAPPLCALMVFANMYEQKSMQTKQIENDQTASVIEIKDHSSEGYIDVFLDTDKRLNTAEASIRIGYDTDFPGEKIKKVISNNTERSVWEWKKLGTFSKLDDKHL